MRLYEPFQFLTAEECDNIIAYGSPRKKRYGTLIGEGNTDLRNNRVVWYKDTSKWQEWINVFNTIENKIDWIMDPQISYYTPGEHYGWHTDKSESMGSHKRYFTLTCNLQTAPGSGFEIEGIDLKNMEKGEAVIFPSTDNHRAITPTSGERISLTIWAMAKNANNVDIS